MIDDEYDKISADLVSINVEKRCQCHMSGQFTVIELNLSLYLYLIILNWL